MSDFKNQINELITKMIKTKDENKFRELVKKANELIKSDENANNSSLLQFMVLFNDFNLIVRYKKSFNSLYNGELNKKDSEMKNVIHIAVLKNISPKIIKFLLKDNKTIIEAKSCNGKTPLYFAVRYNNVKLTRLLLAHEAKPDKIVRDVYYDERYNNETPLICAVRKGHYDIVDLLIKYDADVNIRIKTYDADDVEIYGDSALHLAVKSEQTNITKLLLKHGASPNIVNELGQTPLFYAVNESRNYEIIKLLIKYGARINIIDNHGKNMFDYVRHTRKFIKHFTQNLYMINMNVSDDSDDDSDDDDEINIDDDDIDDGNEPDDDDIDDGNESDDDNIDESNDENENSDKIENLIDSGTIQITKSLAPVINERSNLKIVKPAKLNPLMITRSDDSM